jgi:hypothetical protein
MPSAPPPSAPSLAQIATELPSFMFDKASVCMFAPPEAWCVYYLLDSDGVPIRVGSSAEPRRRLLEHLRAGWPATRVAVEVFRTPTTMQRRERQLTDAMPWLCDFGRRHASWRLTHRRRSSDGQG